ncbi:MAG: glutamate--tRNA ligase [Alphaproteobacteria bacterium]|nr:glutamate--tRNA ligase [Alphaproteobacteria bacterium]
MNMTPEIIDLLFPNPLPSVSEIEAKYPARQLEAGQKVTRVAPSPTGFMHVGGIYAALMSERVAHQSGGVFYLRVEDTDQKRKVEGATEVISTSLSRYGIFADEGVDKDGNSYGPYGSYTQSERKEIYQAYAKKLLEEGQAYPCFCAAEDLDLMRKIQEKQSMRPGYYGRFAKCRTLSDDEILEKLKAGTSWVLRFKSPGNNEKRMVIKDLLKGDINMPESDLDVVILKGDGLPTYHFAHAVDDHLMGTTHVIRGDEWVSSVPLHIQLFVALGWKAPKYGHYATLQKLDNGNKRKLSKRHDPEANIVYFWEKGYPEKALIEYLLNLINASFEDWRNKNPEKDAFEYPMSFSKISNTAGALFDFQKLHSISKEVVAKMSADEVYMAVLNWAKEYNKSFADKLEAQKEYVTSILNIERNIGKKSRKDLIKWEDVESDISYFFADWIRPDLNGYKDELPVSEEEMKQMGADFMAVYNKDDDKDSWFKKVQEVALKHGFAADTKSYKEAPQNYRGSIIDVANVLRVLVTGRTKSPDLYAIMQIMPEDLLATRL